jgi:hypothetical protein
MNGRKGTPVFEKSAERIGSERVRKHTFFEECTSVGRGLRLTSYSCELTRRETICDCGGEEQAEGQHEVGIRRGVGGLWIGGCA